MDIERGPEQDPLKRQPQSPAKGAESLSTGGAAHGRQAVDLPAPAARELNLIGDAPWEVDLSHGENLLRFLAEHASTSTVDGALGRAQREPGDAPQEGDVHIGARGDFFLVLPGGSSAWNPSGQTVAVPPGASVIKGDQVLSELGRVVQVWKEAAAPARVEQALEQALPGTQWVNWGDQDFVKYGGLQLKREGDTVDLVNLSSTHEPGQGYTFILEKGSLSASDLYGKFDGRFRFTGDVMQCLASAGQALESDNLVDLTEAQLQDVVTAYLSGVVGYGGVLEHERTWEPRKMLAEYAKAQPLGGINLPQAIPVKELSFADALDRTNLQEWVDSRVAEELAAMGLQCIKEFDTERYPGFLDTPKALRCPFECSDHGLTIVHELTGQPRNYLHEVSVREGSQAEAFLKERAYTQHTGHLDKNVQVWTYVKQIGLDQAADWAREPEAQLVERMEAFHAFFNRAALAWVNDEPFHATPAEIAATAQLVDGIMDEQHTSLGVKWPTTGREDLIRRMVTQQWAFMRNVTKPLGDQEREAIAAFINKAVSPAWTIDSVWEKEGVADRFTVMFPDGSALGLSERPDRADGFSQWTYGVTRGEHLGLFVSLSQMPLRVLEHAISRIEGVGHDEDDGPTPSEIEAEVAEADARLDAELRDAHQRRGELHARGNQAARRELIELMTDRGLGWKQALDAIAARARDLAQQADYADNAAVRRSEVAFASGYHQFVKDMEKRPAFPDVILSKLRERKGLEPTDASRDAEIMDYTPLEALSEMAAWEFGDPTWAGTFIRWAKECGFSVVARKDREHGWIEHQVQDLSQAWEAGRQAQVRDRFAEMTGLEAAAVGIGLVRALEKSHGAADFQEFLARLVGSKR